MKRLHLHVRVADLAASRTFYERLFGAAPARVEGDYAKWMLEDPPLNFAISTRGSGQPGIDHLGIQVDSDEALVELKARALQAAPAVADEGPAECCYARSDKHWVVDPQGLAWEHFHTLHDIPVFGRVPGEKVAAAKEADHAANDAGAETIACCAPRPAATAVTAGAAASSPNASASASRCC